MKRFTQLFIIALVLFCSAVVHAQSNNDIPKDTIKIKLRGNTSFGKEPLYVVDGKVMAVGINELDPNQIESISILKDASAIALYGQEAIDGAIVITTKKSAAAASSVIIGNGGNGTKVILRGKNSFGKDPLVILDGNVITNEDLLEVSPNKIQSVQILKDASAIVNYGPSAENGVIIVTTKKATPTKN